MCGRYSLAAELADILQAFQVEQSEIEMNYKTRYNISPTQRVAGVVNRDGKRALEAFHWGLIPSWAKDKKIAYNTINARAETIQTKPAFRSLITRKRMIICASGFFEWKTEGKEKQPYCIVVKDRKVFGFAGLYDTWVNPEGEQLQSCTIITTEPNSLMATLHDRMPVILNKNGIDAWLDPELTNKDDLQSLLIPFPEQDMQAYPVSKIVGNVKNETPEVLLPI